MKQLWVVLGTFAIGCHASAGVQASANTEDKARAQAELELDSTSNTPTSSTTSLSPQPPRENGTASTPLNKDAPPPALLGARAGLHLARTDSLRCQCLAVVVAQPNHPGFRWDGEPSTIDPNSQLVVALSSEGVPCAEPPNQSLGASYYGYEASGTDVVVKVEIGRLGRPLAAGAVIPKPTGNGRVLVQPVGAKNPYGRSLDGKSAQCVVWTAH